jgi:WXXGXW repeat (2 copies)
MKNRIGHLLRAPGASLRLAGGLGLLSLAALPVCASGAVPLLGDISLNIMVDAPPPPPRQEIIVGVSPGPDFVWVGGYWDGSPGHYTWVGGRWDHSPHGHGQVWLAPHWDKDRDGHYHQTKGEWREAH